MCQEFISHIAAALSFQVASFQDRLWHQRQRGKNNRSQNPCRIWVSENKQMRRGLHAPSSGRPDIKRIGLFH